MAIAMTQPPMSGLSGLIDFTDNLQEADTGIERMEAFRKEDDTYYHQIFLHYVLSDGQRAQCYNDAAR